MLKEPYLEFLLRVDTRPNAKKLIINQWAYNNSEIRKTYGVRGSPEGDYIIATKLYEAELAKAKEYQKQKEAENV
jgi:hypothetical protein